MIADTLYARSLPPYPEGPPDAGVYGYLLGMILILSCVPLGLLLTLVGGILELIRRRR